MRMEDLDEHRAVEGSAEAIYDDLHWLGLDWDEGPDVGGESGPYVQSERKEIYEAALRYLEEHNEVFRCYCSRKDIREASTAPHGRTILYPGTCRQLTPMEEKQVQESKGGKTPSFRIRADDAVIRFDDEIAGAFEESISDDVGDFVLRRADEFFAYQLAVVVDDCLMGITDVVRGEDLLDSTGRQVWLYQKLSCQGVPRFWHVPLMTDEEGNRMSKRDGSKSLHELREKGRRPDEVVGLLAASLGWVESGETLSASELLKRLELDDVRKLSA